MMPYRAGEPAPAAPPAPELTFRRKNVGLFTAFVIALAAMVVLLPLPLFAVPRGFWFFRNGGWGMYVLVAMSLVVAVGCALAGAFAVRGQRAAAALAVAVPIVPAVLGALLGAVALRRGFSAIAGMEADNGDRMRIVAAALGESDSLPAYGCFLSAIACGASACALLAGAATVDRKHHNVRAGRAWAAPLAIGGLAFIVAVALRIGLRVGGTTLVFAVPSIVMISGLACVAALNAPLVRDWREPREADRWIVSLFAAALLAAGGLVLLELAAAYLNEAQGLGAIAGEAVDPSQKARILAEVAAELHAYRVLAAVDGLFAFAVIATVAFAGVGRGSNGKLRIPGGAPLYVALGATALAVASIVATRTWAFGRIEEVAQASTGAEPATAIELPRVPMTERLSASSRAGWGLRVDATGGKRTLRPPQAYEAASTVLVVEADRRAEWVDVARGIREAQEAYEARGRARATSIDIRVTLLEKADRTQLGPYGVLLGNETAILTVALASRGPGYDDDFDGLPFGRARTAMRPGSHEIMDAIAAAIAKRPGQRFGSAPSDVAILPPEGSW